MTDSISMGQLYLQAKMVQSIGIVRRATSSVLNPRRSEAICVVRQAWALSSTTSSAARWVEDASRIVTFGRAARLAISWSGAAWLAIVISLP